MNAIRSPLVYLNLASRAGRTLLREDPLVSALELHHRDGDPRLLIALGDISGSSRPIMPRRMTRLADILVLWLDEQEWLVLPHHRYGRDLEQALENCFAKGLSLEPIPDGSFHAELSEQAARVLADAESVPLNGTGRVYIDNHALKNLCIRPWTSLVHYDLVLTRQDKAHLEQWLAPLQPQGRDQ